ncbi:MAG: prenyltransferase/squalene oxidase repeat-containing protein, partial [Planctomycetota bacterium]
VNRQSITATHAAARQALLQARHETRQWEGCLSSSALSTATASCALTLLDRVRPAERLSKLVEGGLNWLAQHQNADGGWGDTVDSPSNISTTALVWAAFRAAQNPPQHEPTIQHATDWLQQHCSELTPVNLALAIKTSYGDDHTFSVSILTMCALAGCLGSGRAAWRDIPALPFELAALPWSWFSLLGLPVVSYALPALIAIGQVQHHHCPATNPLSRLLRNITRGRTLRVLRSIQPSSGGFLEATPLTSFVLMSLVSSGQADHAVVEQGCDFLVRAARPDGSWPIDTNLATWLTTLSINALSINGQLPTAERDALRAWLLDQQFREVHPYTHAAPGGWAWTDLPGGVPDADDTAGALLALRHLDSGDAPDADTLAAAHAGVKWLCDLQNRDGGIPTFCRGWGTLPFDRSAPDLTAHALRAWHAWRPLLSTKLAKRVRQAERCAVEYLLQTQRKDGTWLPLWFGNQQAPHQENPLYGTTRVLRAAQDVKITGELAQPWLQALQRATQWILSAQNADGGWGAARDVSSSIEETALAVEALATSHEQHVRATVQRGCEWLALHTECGTSFEPAPIGLYFARLWYSERLYPLVFTVAALEQALPIICRDPVP